MPVSHYRREVALLEPSLRSEAKRICTAYNIPMAKLLRMSLKLALRDEKTIKQLLKNGDPSISTDD